MLIYGVVKLRLTDKFIDAVLNLLNLLKLSLRAFGIVASELLLPLEIFFSFNFKPLFLDKVALKQAVVQLNLSKLLQILVPFFIPVFFVFI